MRICYKAGNVTYNTNYYSVITDSVEIRIWFLTDEIIRIRAGFDGDWDEASYSLAMTAWDSRTDEFLKGYRKRVEVAYSELVDGTDKAVICGSKLRIEIEKNPFRICVYDKDGTLIQTHAELTYETMEQLNSNPSVSRIQVEGNIPFVTADDVSLVLVDTPGPNNSRDPEHKAATYRMLSESSKPLVLYIMNATQLAVNDDYNLLSHVAESMKVGGKQSRDRFIFVHHNRSVITQLLAAHHLYIHLYRTFAYAFIDAFVFIKGIRASIYQIFQRPASIRITQTVINCFITD